MSRHATLLPRQKRLRGNQPGTRVKTDTCPVLNTSSSSILNVRGEIPYYKIVRIHARKSKVYIIADRKQNNKQTNKQEFNCKFLSSFRQLSQEKALSCIHPRKVFPWNFTSKKLTQRFPALFQVVHQKSLLWNDGLNTFVVLPIFFPK